MASSIRGSLLGWYGLIVSFVVAGFGFSLYRVASASMLESIDTSIRGRADALAGALEWDEEDGWELELQALATDQLTLGLNFASMDARWNVDPESCLDAATLALLSDPVGGMQGDKLVGVPDHSGSAFFQYDFPIRNYNAFVRADIQFQGEVDRNERREDRNIANPSYTLAHLKAGIESERWGASLYIRNVTDELAHLSLFNNFQQENRVTASRPRTVGVTLDWRF